MSFPLKKQQVMDHLSRMVDLENIRSPPRSVLKNEPKDESVESKWEHLQYYEQRWNETGSGDLKPEMASLPSAAADKVTDSSYSSLASSEASSSQSRSSSCGDVDSSKSKSSSTRTKFQRIKRQSWQRFKSSFSSKSNCHPPSSVSYGDFSCAVSSNPAAPASASADPSANPDPTAKSGGGGVMSKIRSSKSMQNLEALTADSYYNLRDVTTNLKEKYHSRVELNRGKPKTEYNELWDEESDMDEDEIRMRTLEMVGLF